MRQKLKKFTDTAGIRFTWVLTLFIIAIVMLFSHRAGSIMLKGAIEEYEKEQSDERISQGGSIMKVGTKSVLFGAHCFFLHPFFLARAWWKLYGFPFDPRLWVAFFVHDLGYIGKPNMDGPEGETHPFLGARIMSFLFDWPKLKSDWVWAYNSTTGRHYPLGTWGQFCLYHSRFLAKKNNAQYSRLCVADKLAIVITPSWLYLPMVNWTGEIKEYMKDAEINSNGDIPVQSDQLKWHKSVQKYVKNWVEEHKDLKKDTWTQTKNRRSANQHGVYQ